jgi:hypothetical protein
VRNEQSFMINHKFLQSYLTPILGFVYFPLRKITIRTVRNSEFQA